MDDSERLDWLEQQIRSGQRIEFAKSLFGTGVEIGRLPRSAAVVRPSVREVIDAMRSKHG